MYEAIKINGVDFIFSPFENIETASLGIFLRAGSRIEEKSLKGIAHFLEHMLFKGSRNYSYRQIKREIEGRGGSLNAFTSQEITAYYAHFLNKNLPRAMDILLDMVFNPLLKDSEIDKERNVILEEIKMYNDLPSSRAGVILDSLLWKNHPLGEEIIGCSDTVKKIGRSDLDDFRRKYYAPSNMVISFSGAYPKEEIIGLLVKKIKKAKYKVNLEYCRPSFGRGLEIKCERKSLEQSHLCLGFRSISYLSEKRLTAQLINIILGANMSSRLFEELREKKPLCYDVSTEVRKYRDSGSFSVHLGLDKSKLATALKTVLRELGKIKEKEVSVKELSRAKDYFLGQSAMSLERPGGRMFYLAESFLTLGKIYNFPEIKKKIESVTPRQIKSLAEDIFRFKNMCISYVGNIEDKSGEKIREIVRGRDY
ncbi:MAG: insulinase family protein [Candidatus Omnitrophica bacterium]|nr:insulinase family protein [Candidatus Omnitrophota bacterium]